MDTFVSVPSDDSWPLEDFHKHGSVLLSTLHQTFCFYCLQRDVLFLWRQVTRTTWVVNDVFVGEEEGITCCGEYNIQYHQQWDLFHWKYDNQMNRLIISQDIYKKIKIKIWINSSVNKGELLHHQLAGRNYQMWILVKRVKKDLANMYLFSNIYYLLMSLSTYKGIVSVNTTNCTVH